MNGHGAEHGRRPLPDAFRLLDELPTLRTTKYAKERLSKYLYVLCMCECRLQLLTSELMERILNSEVLVGT